MGELTKELMVELVPKQYKKLVNDDLVDEINKLTSDPDYGEEYKDAMLSHTNILAGSERWTLRQYADAVKYYSLTSCQMTQADAYCKVFPDRLQSRIDRGQSKDDIYGEASRYNSSELVNRVRNQALVPIYLANQTLFQKAINKQASLMMSARSEAVQQKAADSLMEKLAPPVESKIALEVGLNEDAQEQIMNTNAKLTEIAKNQQELFRQGNGIGNIQTIHSKKEEIIEADIDE